MSYEWTPDFKIIDESGEWEKLRAPPDSNQGHLLKKRVGKLLSVATLRVSINYCQDDIMLPKNIINYF